MHPLPSTCFVSPTLHQSIQRVRIEMYKSHKLDFVSMRRPPSCGLDPHVVRRLSARRTCSSYSLSIASFAIFSLSTHLLLSRSASAFVKPRCRREVRKSLEQ
ncbi:hypothetical protein SCHPADRAFT_933915, partial [Schizopora paradoxa]